MKPAAEPKKPIKQAAPPAPAPTPKPDPVDIDIQNPLPELVRRVAATTELRLAFDHAIPDQLGF